MADYFTEYSTFPKGLPSPADTPYETPDFIRSKRSSRVTTSREHSISPPLPPDANEHQEKAREGRYSGVDPRRFTPTLHASLVSEILNLRRELDSKNNLVENLETSFSNAKAENESLQDQLSQRTQDVRKAKQQVQQIEKGVYDAVEDVVKERDAAKTALEDLRSKFETTQRRARQQDEDALRTQSIWQNEKESWDNERRQLERRVHVTETRLRAVVDEMASHQSQTTTVDEHSDETGFKDSGLGDGSDTASIRTVSPTKHKRNTSSVSFNPHGSVVSRRTAATPDLYAQAGNSLADEMGIEEEDEYDVDGSEHPDEEYDDSQPAKAPLESRQDSMTCEADAEAKHVRDLSVLPLEALTLKEIQNQLPSKTKHFDLTTTPPPGSASPEPTPRVVYVDTGYQPSPPPSPPIVRITADTTSVEEHSENLSYPAPVGGTATIQSSVPDSAGPPRSLPTSPPQTLGANGTAQPQEHSTLPATRYYSTAWTQTDFVEPEQQKVHTPNRDSLSLPQFVPSIAIHPPTSRPSSPRPYVLPPGTKNASAQANLGWPCKDASVQTEEIRIDRRPVRLPAHLLPQNLLPSPPLPESIRSKRGMSGGTANIFTKIPPLSVSAPTTSIPTSPRLQSPTESISETSRDNSSKGLRTYPLKAIPLPKPILSPVFPPSETIHSNGPLNRSSQYGVTQARTERHHSTDIDHHLELHDHDELGSDSEFDDMTSSAPALIRPPPGRFGLSEPPKAVPEDKEISPERRPDTADSKVAAQAPSIASSRATSQRRHVPQTSKLAQPDSRRDFRSRSPSFGSYASSSWSTQSIIPMPPYPIPLRSSSRVPTKPHSEGSQSPTPRDVFGVRNGNSGRSQLDRQISLRKVQSAAAIRNRTGKGSPPRPRRRRRSPDLTPVQSMAFESPTPTDFPIPDLPTPLQDHLNFAQTKDSNGLPGSADGASPQPRVSEETHLVDAIAATMVGEWMWKYMRKRKSFGIGENSSEYPAAEYHGNVNNATGHGTRHKRWVWLSPYERTIMWDNKQPSSGPALLGKKGRKLAIQSVADVEDHTPLPKAPELQSAWKRSILILTPQRALKFTAVNEERHHLWLTALCFLAQSGQLPSQIPQNPPMTILPVPPVPSIPSNLIDGAPSKHHHSPSFGRSKVRDSIRLAQGKRPDFYQTKSQPDQPYAMDMNTDDGDQNESADFPAVPRLYIGTTKHQRKRSNTSPRLVPAFNNLRSISSAGAPSSTSVSSAHQHMTSTNASSFRPSASSKSGSRQDSIASPHRPNFFEAVGTVRMEAFVDPNVRNGVLYVPAPPPPAIGAPSRRHRGASNLSQATVDKRRAGYIFDEDGMDPFKGF